MSQFACYEEIGCDAFILIDKLSDGTERPFLRKVCKDFGADTTTVDFLLDGITPYTVEGTVIPVGSGGGGECAATVTVRRMYDIARPAGSELNADAAEPLCAPIFLRHFVYDCEGKITQVYDTKEDGLTPYYPVNPREILNETVPTISYLVWPSIRHRVHPEDNGQNKKFELPVQNPKTGEVGVVVLDSATAAAPTAADIPHLPGCNYSGEFLYITTPAKPAEDWRDEPHPDSRFTYTPDDVVKGMSVLRLEFEDIDTFEGVWGLTPWPDVIVDINGRTDTIEVDPAYGAIHSKIDNNSVYVYYSTIPEQITHLYRFHSGPNGTSCRAARFTGYTIEVGPCCGCTEEADESCHELISAGFKRLEDGMQMILPPDGYDLLSVRVQSLRGETEIRTADGTSYVPDGADVSWEAQGTNASLTPMLIGISSLRLGLANVSWTARRLPGNLTSQVLCDPQGALTEFFNVDSSNGNQTLANSVQIQAPAPTSQEYGYGVQPLNGTFTINFGDKLPTIEFGLTFVVTNGQQHAVVISKDVDPYWINTDLCTWIPDRRKLIIKPSITKQDDLNPLQVYPVPPIAKFMGYNVTQVQFGPDANDSTSYFAGAELLYLKATVPGTVSFVRQFVKAKDGTIICTRDTTLDGLPYKPIGTLSFCGGIT